MPLEISYKFRRRKRQLFLKRISIISFIFVSVFLGAAYFADRSLRVTEIKVLGIEGISDAEIKNYAGDFLGEGLLFSWFKENIIFFKPKNLEEELKKQFSAINNIEVSRNFMKKTVEIQIGERDNWAVWCGQKCFYMDNEGIIFKEAPKFFGQLFLKINDEREVAFKIGDRVIDALVLKNLNDFMDKSGGAGLMIKNMDVNEGGEFLLYFKNETASMKDTELKILLDAQTDFGAAYENLKLVLNEVFEKKVNKIDYIDLRFKDKVFYK